MMTEETTIANQSGDNVLVCALCEHGIGNYNNTDLGMLCDDCYEVEYLREQVIDARIQDRIEGIL